MIYLGLKYDITKSCWIKSTSHNVNNNKNWKKKKKKKYDISGDIST